MEQEIWRTIPGIDNSYEASNLGRIRSLKGRKGSNYILKRQVDRYGYLYVSVSPNGRKRKAKKVHRLVAAAFIPTDNYELQVNHINGIKTDNRPENLEWCSPKENHLHALKTGLKKMDHLVENRRAATLSKNSNAKPVFQYTLDGKLVRKWDCVIEAARAMGRKGSSNIRDACYGRQKTSDGFKWSYHKL